MPRPDWSLLTHRNSRVAEMPQWCSGADALYWIDMYDPSLCRTRLDGTTDIFSIPDEDRLGSFALRPGGAMVAGRSRLLDVDLHTGSVTTRMTASFDGDVLWFNDGRSDPRGRFVVGCNQDPELPPEQRGHYVVVDGSGMRPLLAGVTTANGTAFSPDGRTLYVAETRRFEVYAFDYDLESGTASSKRLFTRLPGGHYPDGAAVDIEGGYWIAAIGAGVVVRYLPDGTQDRVIRTPTLFPTMVAFGGAERTTLFLTTSAKYLHLLSPDERRAEEGVAGGLFVAEIDIPGLPEPRLSF